jgi:hypothetical protein
MKVNLYGEGLRNGYVNIVGQVPDDLSNLPDATEVAVGDFKNLDPVVPDGQAEELIFNVPLNAILPVDLVEVLQHWNKKLANKGILRIGYVDIRRLGKSIHSGELTLQEIDNLIFGPDHHYHCLIDTDVLKILLGSVGYSINYISPKDFFVTIEARKNVN